MEPEHHEKLQLLTQKQALRLLDDEGVYNHLYFVSAKFAKFPHKAEDKLGNIWGTLYDIVHTNLSGKPHDSLEQFRELAGRYLATPELHSSFIRNRLMLGLLDAAFPNTKGIEVQDNTLVAVLLGTLVLIWIFPGLGAIANSIFYSALVAVTVWWLFNYRSNALLKNLRGEIASGFFNDGMIKDQLMRLNKKRPRLPSIIFDLIDQSFRFQVISGGQGSKSNLSGNESCILISELSPRSPDPAKRRNVGWVRRALHSRRNPTTSSADSFWFARRWS
jgi:hypothetical protein